MDLIAIIAVSFSANTIAFFLIALARNETPSCFCRSNVFLPVIFTVIAGQVDGMLDIPAVRDARGKAQRALFSAAF